MEGLERHDLMWDRVLTLLSSEGALGAFYRTPRYEMKAIMSSQGEHAVKDLHVLFSLLEKEQLLSALDYRDFMGELRVKAALTVLLRLLACWRLEEGYPTAHA